MPQVGLYLPQVNRDHGWLLACAQTAEEAGCDSVWFMDHLTVSEVENPSILEGWTLATYVAAKTETIRIGHLVLANAFRHPVVLGKMAATLDQLSDGRLELGLGWGSSRAELAGFGITDDPPSVRVSKLDEAIPIIRQVLAGGRVAFDGRHYAVPGGFTAPPAAQARVPLHLGGVGPRTMELVRRHADWWNCPSYAWHRLDELWGQQGQAKVSVGYPVFVTTEPDQADVVRRRLAPSVERAAGPLVIGTVDEVADRLRAEAKRGIDRCIVQLVNVGDPDHVGRFLADLVPALA